MSSAYESVYKVITPSGVFDAVFGGDDAPVLYQGDDAAIQFFQNWVSLNQVSGEHGILINADRITPIELYGFCQPPGSGITVVPPLEDALHFAEQDENEFDDSEGGEVMLKNESALDSATGIEKINLVKELSGIRETMKTDISGIEKLRMVKRVSEIRALLGVKEIQGENGSASIVIATFKNEEDNIEVGVAKITSGYSVTLKDLDSGEVLPFATIYPDEGTAIQKAKEIAKVDQKVIPEPGNKPSTLSDAKNMLPILKRFIGDAQLSVMLSSAKGEEGQFFIDKLIEVANTVSTMPKTYEQDGKGDEAIVYLHYFKGSADWYITERDMEDEQLQAFGLADLFGDSGDLGYISIDELITSDVEMDLYWKPTTLKIIRGD